MVFGEDEDELVSLVLLAIVDEVDEGAFDELVLGDAAHPDEHPLAPVVQHAREPPLAHFTLQPDSAVELQKFKL